MYGNKCYGCGSGGAHNIGYSLGPAGAIETNATHLVNNDPPNYAVMAYTSSHAEMVNDLKYGKVEIDYDSNLKEIKESMDGAPIEMYVPQSRIVDPGVGKQEIVEKIPKKLGKTVPQNVNQPIISEIEDARKAILSKEVVMREVEEVVMVRRRTREVLLREKSIR